MGRIDCLSCRVCLSFPLFPPLTSSSLSISLLSARVKPRTIICQIRNYYFCFFRFNWICVQSTYQQWIQNGFAFAGTIHCILNRQHELSPWYNKSNVINKTSSSIQNRSKVSLQKKTHWQIILQAKTFEKNGFKVNKSRTLQNKKFLELFRCIEKESYQILHNAFSKKPKIKSKINGPHHWPPKNDIFC